MDASEKTKYKLAGAVRELMVFTPVDRITVKQIVERCDVTRQTFYRNFKDKYDLINWYFDKLAIVSFRQMGVSLTLREGLIKKFEFIKGERCFFTAAFKSEDHNSLLQHDFDFIFIHRNLHSNKLFHKYSVDTAARSDAEAGKVIVLRTGHRSHTMISRGGPCSLSKLKDFFFGGPAYSLLCHPSAYFPVHI